MTLVSGNLVVPLVLWGRHPPTHVITSILVLSDDKVVVSGSLDGQLCIWDQENDEIFPRSILFGHTAKVNCLAPGGRGSESGRFISASDNGELILWDSVDSRCLESCLSPNIHNAITAHILESGTSTDGDLRLFCRGNYSEIIVMDPLSLTTLFTLCSRVEPDWISCLCVLKPAKRQDIVIGLSNSGMVKIWAVGDVERKGVDIVYEDESKQIKSTDAVSITCCHANQRTMLVICSSYWQIYDASDFSLICSVDCPKGDTWLGGDFVKIDKVGIFCSNGRVYLYQLPRSKLKGKAVSAILGDPQALRLTNKEPMVYCVLTSQDQNIEDFIKPPVFAAAQFRPNVVSFLRAENNGFISLWTIPEVSDKTILALQQETFDRMPELNPDSRQSIAAGWTKSPPVGIIDHLLGKECSKVESSITKTLYVASQGRLVLGLRSGSVVIVSATHAIMRETLEMKSSVSPEWTGYRTLVGHSGAVSCLLYPHAESQRFEPKWLVSGGVDFCVCLWDLYTGALLNRFCNQAGEIERLMVPPDNCVGRVLNCICSVAHDHSVALLSLKELKCVLMASRHVFPVKQVKWRPLDDFLLVQTDDGSVYVWQMETCNLDRVVSGLMAEEILNACAEQEGVFEIEDDSGGNTAQQMIRAVKNKNMAAIKKIAADTATSDKVADNLGLKGIAEFPSMAPMLIQSIQTNKNDSEAHLLLFNIEALIVELLKEEHLRRVAAANAENPPAILNSGDSSPLTGLLGRVRNKAENMLGVSPTLGRKQDEIDAKKQVSFAMESNLNMEIAQVLLSFLHGWAMDEDLDKVCLGKLGLHRPSRPFCCGLISREGFMSLTLPSAHKQHLRSFTEFSKLVHWGVSTSITTQHLLSVISIANTLMGIRNSSFVPDQEKRRRLVKRLSVVQPHNESSPTSNPPRQSVSDMQEALANEQSQIRQGWSLVAALHCVLLPELVDPAVYKSPRIELLARRWQERCFEIREAAQALLLRELTRAGPIGRRKIIDVWSCFIPTTLPPPVSIFGGKLVSTMPSVTPSEDSISRDSTPSTDSSYSPWEPLLSASDRVEPFGTYSSAQVSLQEIRRNQATAVVILGVIGAEFSQEIVSSLPHSNGTNGAVDYVLVRATSQSLLELLLHPPTSLLPSFSPLRRAAIDLLGRGFVVWEPYLEMSKVLLGLLDLCANGDKLLPSMKSTQFPLTPQADSCRTARHALALIATARPPALITALGKEVARYNQMLQHQALQHTVNSPLVRAKGEILKIIESLIEKQYQDVVDLMLSVGEVLVFCLDVSLLKHKSLSDVYPPISKFHMVAYCQNTRRISFGGKNGAMSIHDLRAGKFQTLQAHSKAITAICFSEDGKMLSSYSADEGKLNFWQASQSFLGMGQSQIKLLRQVPAPTSFPVVSPSGNPTSFRARLVWISPKAVTVMLPNGKEHRIAMA